MGGCHKLLRGEIIATCRAWEAACVFVCVDKPLHFSALLLSQWTGEPPSVCTLAVYKPNSSFATGIRSKKKTMGWNGAGRKDVLQYYTVGWYGNKHCVTLLSIEDKSGRKKRIVDSKMPFLWPAFVLFCLTILKSALAFVLSAWGSLHGCLSLYIGALLWSDDQRLDAASHIISGGFVVCIPWLGQAPAPMALLNI